MLVYSARSGMNRVQVVLSGFSMRLFVMFPYVLFVFLYVGSDLLI